MRLLKTAANQVAQILSHFRLRETLATKEKERDEYRRRMIEANRQLKDYEKIGGETRVNAPVKTAPPAPGRIWRRRPASATAVAHVVGTFLSTIDRNLRTRDIRRPSTSASKRRSCARSPNSTRSRHRMASLMPESELKIFDGSQNDPARTMSSSAASATSSSTGYAAESALFRVIDELSAQLLAVADGYLRERATDFRDVGHRVLRHLRQDDRRKVRSASRPSWSPRS